MTGSPPMLEVAGITIGYPGRTVIDNASLQPLAGGSVSALVGPNAAGKTTLLRGLAGLARTRGSIRFAGAELTGLSATAHARYVSYMPQSLPQRAALTVYEAMLGALRASGIDTGDRRGTASRAMEALERLGIAGLANRPLDQLSGGQRQLASLAQCIVREPPVLLLDEPTSALDLAHQFRVMRTVRELTRERGMATIVVLHDIALAARWCERIVVLSGGRVAADGAVADAVTPGILADVYGVEARVERCSRGTLQIIVDGTLDDAAGGLRPGFETKYGR